MEQRLTIDTITLQIAEWTRKVQEMSATVVEGNGAVTGHIIITTIGGKNGEPKRVLNFSKRKFVDDGRLRWGSFSKTNNTATKCKESEAIINLEIST